eukprot:364816-Chlamydomonas_euryale.AAC.1
MISTVCRGGPLDATGTNRRWQLHASSILTASGRLALMPTPRESSAFSCAASRAAMSITTFGAVREAGRARGCVEG